MRLDSKPATLGLTALVVLSQAAGCACSGKTDTGSVTRASDTTPSTGSRASSGDTEGGGSTARSDTSPEAAELWDAIDSGAVDPTRYGDGNDQNNELFEAEILARARFELTPISLTGSVHDASGAPLPNATIEVGGQSVTSDSSGFFSVEGLARENTALHVSAPNHKDALTHVHLQRAISVEQFELTPIVLTPANSDVVRFLFGGDTAFGRRFVDPGERTPPLDLPRSDPNALIDAEAPESGTRNAMRHVRPWFQNADFPVVNLETPVTGTPSEYHSTKQYTFYTLPGSMAVFPWLGLSYVSLGNNHLYDYLEDGVLDTLAALDEHGISSSGAGLDPEMAFLPHREALGGSVYSLISMTSVSGSQNPPLYVATDDPTKGGAADLRDDDRVATAIGTERDAGNIVIAQLHTGKEYTYWPSDFARDRMSLSVRSGASLVIGHHPHVAQGFAYEDGTLIVSSLGNLCFDQARLETMLGLLTEIDLRGSEVVAAVANAVYLEDYTPRPATGELAEHLFRRVGEVSENANVVLDGGRARVLPIDRALASSTRRQLVDLAETDTVVDLRPLRRTGESLVGAELLAGPGTLQAGQDILVHGDFEDWDVDEQHFELARWDVTGGSSFPCLSGAHRGAVSLCSVRSGDNRSNSVVALRNRVRVLGEELDQPNKDLSLVGYARGNNAGEMWLEVEYYASVGSRVFGREEVWRQAPGEFGWTFFRADLDMAEDEPGTDPLTDNPHALRFFYFQRPPAEGAGIARLDDLAVVSWRPAHQDALVLTPPNPIDFVRVRGPAGNRALELTWQRATAATADNR